MKHKAKEEKLAARQAAFAYDSTIQDANRNSPGTYHKPGSLKK